MVIYRFSICNRLLDPRLSSPLQRAIWTTRTRRFAEKAWDRPDGGRSFGFVGLHFHKNWERIEYRRLVSQAILWSLKMPIPEGGLKDEQSTAMP